MTFALKSGRKTDEFDEVWRTIKKPRNKRELKPPHEEGGLGSKEGAADVLILGRSARVRSTAGPFHQSGFLWAA
jgi:hypothetical protein